MQTPLELTRSVERVDWVEPAGRLQRVDRLPDGRTALVVRTFEGGAGDAHFVGPRTHAMFKRARFARALLIQFRPGWSAPMLGVPASELTDRYVPVEDVWGEAAGQLTSQLIQAREARTAMAHLARALAWLPRAAWQPPSTRLVRRAAHLLELEDSRVEHVAERLGVTPRHLRRVFQQHIGVAPKGFARATRLQRAVRLVKNTNDWGRIAADSGYYDQAHLIAEFRALVGLTPCAFAARITQVGGAEARS